MAAIKKKSAKMAESVETLKSSIDDELYSKVLVEVATNAMREGDLDTCVESVNKVIPGYFAGICQKQMVEDEIFRDTVLYLAYKLVQMGMVDIGFDVSPTQHKGSA